jgi:putative transposase
MGQRCEPQRGGLTQSRFAGPTAWVQVSSSRLIPSPERARHGRQSTKAPSLSRLYVYLIFSTKNREPLWLGMLGGQMHAYLASVLNQHGSAAIRVGGTADHVHALFHLSKNPALAEGVEEIKMSSSRWIKTQSQGLGGFHRQSGYGGFSVSRSELEGAVEYIEKQEEHHRSLSFQDEYRQFVKRHEVEYDERYVWERRNLDRPSRAHSPRAGPTTLGVAQGWVRAALRAFQM